MLCTAFELSVDCTTLEVDAYNTYDSGPVL